jgi:hypothetical protein
MEKAASQASRLVIIGNKDEGSANVDGRESFATAIPARHGGAASHGLKVATL